MKPNFFHFPSLLIFLFTALLTTSIFFALAFRLPEAPKSYSVAHTQQEWTSELDTLEMLRRVIGYPLARQNADAWQLVLARMQQRYILQLVPQYLKERANEKKDSTAVIHKQK